MYDYNKISDRLIFLKRIRYRVKIGLDNHDAMCSRFRDGIRCQKHDILEDYLFFLNSIIDEHEPDLEKTSLTAENVAELESVLNTIKADLSILKLSAEFSYNEIISELEEIKSLYFLNKKNLAEVIVGKFSEMVSGGVISETLSKGLVEVINRNYPSLVESLR
jgi:hypothetical protein